LAGFLAFGSKAQKASDMKNKFGFYSMHKLPALLQEQLQLQELFQEHPTRSIPPSHFGC
jgi:hypothetical protein